MNTATAILAMLTLTALAVGIAGLIAARAIARELSRWIDTPWGI